MEKVFFFSVVLFACFRGGVTGEEEYEATFSSSITGTFTLEKDFLYLSLAGLEDHQSYVWKTFYQKCDELASDSAPHFKDDLARQDLTDPTSNITFPITYQLDNDETSYNVLPCCLEELHSIAIEQCVLVPMVGEEGECHVTKLVSCADISCNSCTDWLTIVIVIVVAVVIFLFLVCCIPLICCCLKRKKTKKLDADDDAKNLDDTLEDDLPLKCRSKSPTYDEISIPFIDASLPPTPKIGRTVNGFDILLGNGRGSSTSISEKPIRREDRSGNYSIPKVQMGDCDDSFN